MAPEMEMQGIDFLCCTPWTDSDALMVCDRTKLLQVMSNLLKNALKFTESGSIQCGYQPKAIGVRFFVIDTGIGIPADKQEMIFDRFSQVEQSVTRNYEGAGLGLSISRAYVELMGGKIEVESEPGKGSEFSFTLPVKLQSDKPQKRRNEYDHLGDFLSEREKPVEILLVEDDAMSREYMEELLDSYNVELFHAKNGKEALEIVQTNIHLQMVLMDLKMPVMGGIEATRAIKRIRPDLPVIIQTAFTNAEEREKAMEAGADDYMTKPLDQEIISLKIRKNITPV